MIRTLNFWKPFKLYHKNDSCDKRNTNAWWATDENPFHSTDNKIDELRPLTLFIIDMIKREKNDKIMHKYCRNISNGIKFSGKAKETAHWKFQPELQYSKWQRWQNNEMESNKKKDTHPQGMKLRASACEDHCRFVFCSIFSVLLIMRLYRQFAVWLFFDFQLIRCC